MSDTHGSDEQAPHAFAQLRGAIRRAEARFLREGAVTSSIALGEGLELCFGKCRKDWCLYISGPGSAATILTNSPLSQRLLAATKLHELFAVHKEECARLKLQIATAIAQFDGFASESGGA